MDATSTSRFHPIEEATPAIVRDALPNPGSRLDDQARTILEAGLGFSFANVRVHHDADADRSARALGAEAYTAGTHIVFAAGNYSPHTARGRRLLAHEIGHVVQQATFGPGVTGRVQRQQVVPVPSTLARLLTPQDLVKLQAFGPAVYTNSLDTLEKMLRFTGDLTRDGLPQSYVTSRQASGELRTFLDHIRNPEVRAVQVVPSASGGRSPDFYVQWAGGAEARVEVVNVTSAPAGVRPVLDADGGRSMPRTPASGPGPATGTPGVSGPPSLSGVAKLPIKEVDAAAKVREAIRTKVGPGSQLSVQNQNTVVAGRQMRVGGELRVSATHLELSRAELDGVFDALRPQLAASSADRVVIDVVDSADPRAGRRLFEYVRDPQGQFRHTGTRPPNHQVSLPTRVDPAAVVVGDLGGGATKGEVGKRTARVLSSEIADATEMQVTSKLLRTEGTELGLAASDALSAAKTSVAKRRLGMAVTPVVGVLMVGPDALRGLDDLGHGHLVTGLGTIGVAIVELASQGLHATDAVTGLGGSALAVTIQVWCATMQFSWESARIKQRSSELNAYMRTHGNRLPPDDELRSYYGLKNDEELMLFKSDVEKAVSPKVTTEQLRDRVRELLASLDAAVDKPMPEGVSQYQLAQERGRLNRLLVALQSKIDEDRRASAAARMVSEAKRRQENFDRAQQQLAVPPPRPGPLQLLPDPWPQRHVGADLNTFGLFANPGPSPFSTGSMSSAELYATGFGRVRAALIERYGRLEPAHFPTAETSVFRQDVANYVDSLDRVIADFLRRGSPEWPGVIELRRLRYLADEGDRRRLLR